MSEPSTVEFELVPIRGRPGCFAAVLPDGRVLIRASRQPLLDGARALAAEGGSREAVIAARHRGSTIVAVSSILAEAAKWTIEESDRGGLRKRLWRPFAMAGSSRDGVPENARGHVDVEGSASRCCRPRRWTHGPERRAARLLAGLEDDESVGEMGLDMYAHVMRGAPSRPVDFTEPEDAMDIHYWRKHPDLHGWMERLYRGKGGESEEFNCVPVALSSGDLDRLEADIKAGGLPHTEGFFFGESGTGRMEGDLAFIAKAREAIGAGLTVYYSSWW